MLAAFIKTNTKNSGIQSVQADQIGRTYPPLFTINLPKEDEVLEDLKEISAMEYFVQAIMIIVCIAVVIIIIYFYCTKCRHTCTIFKYCFPFLPISCIVHTSHHTDLLHYGNISTIMIKSVSPPRIINITEKLLLCCSLVVVKFKSLY